MEKTMQNHQTPNVSRDSAPGGTEAPRGASVPPGAGGRELQLISPPDSEVTEQKSRRKFTAKYKIQILAEADNCTQPGQIGALLRRQGLYSSHLTTWRRQRDQGLLKVMSPKKRGRKQKGKNPLAKRIARLEKENRLLHKKLKKAETIIEIQKKISDLLTISKDQEITKGDR